jgi:hypothetical protein
MVVLAYFGSQCAKFHVVGWMCWFLHPSIWIVYAMRFRDGSDKFCTRLGTSVTEPVQWLDKCLAKKAWAIHRKSKLTETEKGETGEEHAHNFLWNQGDCSQKSILAGQTVNFAYYCDVLQQQHENMLRLHFGDRSTGCCIMTTHHLTLSLSPGNFCQKLTWLSSPTHPTFLCFPNWRYNWKAAILTQLRWQAEL